MADISIENLDKVLSNLEKRNRIPILIYTVFSAVCFLVAFLILAKLAVYDRDYQTALSLAAPTGIIGLCGERMLRIWKDSIETIKLLIEKSRQS